MVVGFSLWCLLLLQSTGSKHVGVSSCGPQAQLPSACRIFPDRGLNPHPLLWQADSYPLDHQEVPTLLFVLPQCSVFGEGNGNPLQYSCLEKSHGWRTLVGYSPWGRKESDTTELLHFLSFMLCIILCFPVMLH